MKSAGALTLCLHLCAAAGCSLLTGVGHMQPVQVRAYFPSEQFVEAASIGWVSVSFSSPMSRARTEEAFRLSEGTLALPGSYDWQEQGRTLRFCPYSPLRPGQSYTISVSTAAEDLYGNSLDRELTVRFSTGTERDRPLVAEHSPPDGATLSDLRGPVRVRFSEPLQPASVLAGFSLSPSVRGSLSWSAGGAEITFRPLEDYARGQQYTVRLSADICDLSGNHLPETVEFHFRTEQEQQPDVLSVLCPRTGRALLADAVDPSLGIEKDELLLVTLSMPVGIAQREGAITLEPAVPLRLSWSSAGDSCQVGFREHLEWNGLYALRILGRTYGFVINGAGSVPVQVSSIRYCPDIGASPPQFVQLAFAGNYSFAAAPAPVFDFHLRHAQGAAIDLGSFMRALSIEIGGGCLMLRCRALELSPLPVDPDPLPGPGESVVRLLCSIDDDPAVCGPLGFRLDRDLRDSLDNHLAAQHVLVVNNNTD